MAEYIEREAAIKARNRSCKRNCAECDFAIEGDSWCEGEVFVVDLLRIPAADVVPVVRCSECKHWKRIRNDCILASCELYALVRSEDFFCADGVRKDGDGDV